MLRVRGRVVMIVIVFGPGTGFSCKTSHVRFVAACSHKEEILDV